MSYQMLKHTFLDSVVLAYKETSRPAEKNRKSKNSLSHIKEFGI